MEVMLWDSGPCFEAVQKWSSQGVKCQERLLSAPIGGRPAFFSSNQQIVQKNASDAGDAADEVS